MTARQTSLTELGTPLYDVTFVVFDLETTGLVPGRDRITEVGAVKTHRGEIVGEFHALVHPGVRIPAAITAVTGITDAMVRGCPPIEAVLPTFLEFIRDAVLVAHNARFDLSFANAELEGLGYPRLTNRVADTARLGRRAFRDEVRDARLATLARHVRSRHTPDHRALSDARATVDVLHGVLERVGTLGVQTLEDLADYASSRSEPAFRKRSLIDAAPAAPGVYRFLDARDEVLYVGRAVDLRRRLRTYFGQDPRRRIADMIRETARVTWTVSSTELEAQVLEVREIHTRRPRYNRRSKHPENAVWIKLTAERFPRLSIVTKVGRDAATYLGPLSSRRAAQTVVDAIHDAIPIRQCTGTLRLAQDHPACVLKDLGRCGAPCDGTQSIADHAAIADRVAATLSGTDTAVLEALRVRMADAAAAGRFERAGGVRDRIHATASALVDARQLRALVGADEIVATRLRGTVVEVVLVRHGRLAAAGVRDAGEEVEITAQRLRLSAGPTASGAPDRTQVEEVRLVAAWLAGADVALHHVSGEYAEPLAAGQHLSAEAAEARLVAGTVRRDHQHLAGDHVIRRAS